MMADTRTIGPISARDREGLRRLIEFGKLKRLSDGSYGFNGRRVIVNGIARSLKSRRLAVAGFDHDMVPTEKGRRLDAEDNNAAG